MTQITFEQAKQKIANIYGFQSFYVLIKSARYQYMEPYVKIEQFINEAYDLFVSENKKESLSINIRAILNGLAPCERAKKSELEIINGLKAALIFAGTLPNGSSLIGQLCDIADLLCEWRDEIERLKVINNQLFDKFGEAVEKRDLRVKELESGLKESSELVAQALNFNDKRTLTEKLNGTNKPKESDKSSWQKRSEKSINKAKELLK